MSKVVTKSKWLLYSVMIVIVYLLGRAWLYGESLSTGLAVGIMLGMFFGSYYETHKILETKKEISSAS